MCSPASAILTGIVAILVSFESILKRNSISIVTILSNITLVGEQIFQVLA